MAMRAGIRTPAEVIAIALEDAGEHPARAKVLSEAAARRLAVALRSVSTKDAPAIIHSPKAGEIEWGTVNVGSNP